jgi:hypothetical protein
MIPIPAPADFCQMITRVTVDVAHIVVIALSIFIFSYQTRVLERSRLFRNLTYCWLTMALYYLVTIAQRVLLYLLSCIVTGDLAVTTADNLSHLWVTIGTIFSFASTYFLWRSAELLRSYPITQFRKRRAALIQAGLSLLVAASIARMVAAPRSVFSVVIGVLDVVLACCAAWYLGYGFLTFTRRPPAKLSSTSAASWKIATFACFLLWGLLQFPHLAFEFPNTGIGQFMRNLTADPLSLYLVLLMVVKFLCAMAAALFCVLFFEDQPEFRYPIANVGPTDNAPFREVL